MADAPLRRSESRFGGFMMDDVYEAPMTFEGLAREIEETPDPDREAVEAWAERVRDFGRRLFKASP